MKQLFLITLFLISGLIGFSQEPVVIYLDADFIPTTKDSATYIREAVIKNNHYCMTDKKINGTIINYCEYKSLNPMIEHGLAISYDERDSVYSKGNYRYSMMKGKWIYYNKDNSADTVDYSFDEGKSDKSDILNADYYGFNKDTEKAGNLLFDALPSFINANFHMPARALSAGIKNVSLNIECVIDTEGKIRNPEILNLVHPDIKREVYRILSFFHYDGEIKKPFKIIFTGFDYGEQGFDKVAPNEVFVIVEEMPSFPGGDELFFRFITDNIKYPEELAETAINGTVILRFCVTYKGNIDLISITKGVNPLLDAEAVRVIRMLPAFNPGKQGGKPVNVWYSIPVRFRP
jgi:TonB family protein